MTIAQEGYSLAGTPWYPLYPVLIKATGATDISAILLSNLCFFIGLIGLYRLGGKKAVILASVSPIAIVFSAAYSESLFFCLVTWFFVCREEKKTEIASYLAGLATLSRPTGLVLLLFLMYDVYRNWGLVKIRGFLSGLWKIKNAFILGSLYPIFLWFTFNDPISFSTINSEFFSRMFMPFFWGTVQDMGRVLMGEGKPWLEIILLNLAGWIWILFSLKDKNYLFPSLIYGLLILSFPITNPNYAPATHGLLRYAAAWPISYLGMAKSFDSKYWLMGMMILLIPLSWYCSILISQKLFIF